MHHLSILKDYREWNHINQVESKTDVELRFVIDWVKHTIDHDVNESVDCSMTTSFFVFFYRSFWKHN